MKNLKENSIRIDGTVTVVWPQFHKEKRLEASEAKSWLLGGGFSADDSGCYMCGNDDGTVTIVWPHLPREEDLDMSEIALEFNGAYCTNNSTICFVVDHEVFVTPYTDKAISAIKRAGLVRRDFYVPFSNWDYPREEKVKWERLRKAARN